MTDQQKVVHDLSNGAIFNDLEQLLKVAKTYIFLNAHS